MPNRARKGKQTAAPCGRRRQAADFARTAEGAKTVTEDLIAAATAVRLNAYTPYSRFKVGAALRSTSGHVHVGCNVENVAYPEGTCAEAGAIAAMVAGGDERIAEIVVIADSPTPVPPCGGCRQKIAEFASPDVLVTLCTTDGGRLQLTVADLLPGAFGADHMDRA
ncbi:MAG: cytidine deaminase [Paracoccaceae bacterium]|nr:cytidine deaminase [Paracoccaceae bacterium]MDE3121922.1 cytidine deaminase [Paracoccaceae bacterium]